jgi:cytochrome P450
MANEQVTPLSDPSLIVSIPQTPLSKLPQTLKDPLGQLVAARERHGDVYALNLGFSKVIVLSHPSHAQYVLQQNVANYPKGGAIWDSLRTLLGNGLPASNGQFWLRQRRMMQPHFHHRRLVALTNLMIDAIEEEMVSWDAAAESSKSVRLDQVFPHITMKVIVKTLFGSGLSGTDVEKVSKALTYALDFMLRGMITNYFPAWLPVPGRRRYQQAIQEIDEIVLRIIEERRRSREEANDLITMLIHMVDDETGEQMTDEQLRDEAVSMFLAGYETTAVALTWSTHFMLTHPEAWAKLRAEVDEVLGERKPTFDDLPQLPYSRMLLQEAMRLYPPVWWLSRTAVADDEIDGYPIPAGSTVAPMPYVIHRHPEIWEKPEQFDPERFTSEAIAARHKLAWIPFGAGQRICIGKEFALMEGQLILAYMAQRYQLTPSLGNEVKLHAATTLRSKKGVYAQLSKRTG